MRATVMKISERAIFENTRTIRESIPGHVKMMCVVKADGYGHGSVHAAQTMLRAGADAFAVAITEEAEQLREAGISLPILILGGGDGISLRRAVHLDVSQTVYEPWMLDVLQDEARRSGMRAKAHLKIDSGMSRLGLRDGDALMAMIARWKQNCPDVEMEGIFTHFCAAEEDEKFTRLQNERFKEAIAAVRGAGFNPIAHAAASSAMMNGDFQHDMVRAGIGLYGGSVPGLEGRLFHAQTLVTRPTRIQWITAGESVGYGRSFIAKRDTRVMTIPIGYGDGYPRLLSNRACALVCGRRVPIIGNVCMDMVMLDVTDVAEAGASSEVVLMGAQGDERITPDELASLVDTIPYEIMLGFSVRVRRVYQKIQDAF